jgi:DNA repair exonuclease SbcCD ATPase subunit
MKILELRAENFRRLKAVSIRPNGDLVQITGRNGSGKTSTLDAIWVAVRGRAAAPPEPIRRGEEEARITLDLGELVIQRGFKRDKAGDVTQSLKVTRADGSAITKSPQAVLDSFVGALSFDPLAFARAKPSEQFDHLKVLVPGFDFDANAAERKRLFDERTDTNRLSKRDRASAQNIALPAGPKPAPVNVTGLLDELTRIGDHNAQAERIDIKRNAIRDEAERKRDEAERLRARATSLEKEADALDEKLASVELAQKPREDAGPIRAKLGQAETTKGIISLFDARESLENKAAAQEAKARDLTQKIDDLDAVKAIAIEKAKMPVDGLGLGDGLVTLNGLPFQQASDAEQLRTSVAIAMALNPQLRVIRVHEGSLLDSKSLGMLAAMAGSRDMQIWIEAVDESGEVGFYLEDGALAAVDGEKV